MNTTSTNPTEPEKNAAMICLGILACLAVFVIGSLLQTDAKQVVASDLNPEAIAEYVVNEMPDSYLRRNLMTVFGAEYAAESQELNDLLGMYSQMKLEEMAQNNSKDSL